MPYTYKTKTGLVITDIPDDMPNNDQRLKDFAAQLGASGKTSGSFTSSISGATPAEIGQVPTAAELGAAQGGMTPQEAGTPQWGPITIKDMAASAPANLGAAARGIIGGMASPVTSLSDPLTRVINLLLPDNMKQLPPGEGLQSLLTKAGLPPEEAQTEAMKIMQSATSGLSGGASNVLVGKSLSGMGGQVAQVGETLASQPKAQLLGGATAGASSESARALGAPPLAQLGVGLAGGAIGGMAGNMESVPRPAGPLAEAKALKIPILTSDTRPPTTKAGMFLQSIRETLGSGSMRQNQQIKRIDAVRNLVETYGGEDLQASSDLVMKDLLGKRSADIGKWTKAKDDILEKLSTPGEGPEFSKTASERINDLATLEKNKVINPAQKAELDRLRANPGVNVVPMPSTNKKIDEAVKYLEGLSPDIYAPQIKALNSWKEAINGQDLKNIEELRKTIGEVFISLRPEQASNVPSTAEKVLAGIYGTKDTNGIPVDGVLKDMTDFIKKNGGQADLDKWLIANKKLHDMMGELGLASLKTAIDKGEMTPEKISNVLFSRDKSTVAALYRNLSPEGQAAARSAIIAKAAFDSKGNEVLPGQFVDNIKKLGNQTGVFFSPDDMKSVDGLTRVLDYTKRAEVTKLQPQQGPSIKSAIMLPVSAAALSALFGGGVKGFLGIAGGALAVSGGVKLYESRAVRFLLSKLATTKPGSNEEEAVLKSLLVAAQNFKQPSPKNAKIIAPDQYGSTNYAGAPGAPANP